MIFTMSFKFLQILSTEESTSKRITVYLLCLCTNAVCARLNLLTRILELLRYKIRDMVEKQHQPLQYAFRCNYHRDFNIFNKAIYV